MNKSVLCIGASLLDELYFCENYIVSNSSNPAQKATSIGGVCSNIALIKNNAKIAAMIAEALQGMK